MDDFDDIVKELITDINYQYYKRNLEKYKKLELPFLQIRILIYLLKRSATVSEIANDLRIAKSNVSFILKILSKEQLITRNRNTDDERVVMIDLTDKGRMLFDGINTQEDKILGEVSIEDQAVIINGLNVLKALFRRN